jgi:hypothetical protein
MIRNEQPLGELSDAAGSRQNARVRTPPHVSGPRRRGDISDKNRQPQRRATEYERSGQHASTSARHRMFTDERRIQSGSRASGGKRGNTPLSARVLVSESEREDDELSGSAVEEDDGGEAGWAAELAASYMTRAEKQPLTTAPAPGAAVAPEEKMEAISGSVQPEPTGTSMLLTSRNFWRVPSPQRPVSPEPPQPPSPPRAPVSFSLAAAASRAKPALQRSAAEEPSDEERELMPPPPAITRRGITTTPVPWKSLEPKRRARAARCDAAEAPWAATARARERLEAEAARATVRTAFEHTAFEQAADAARAITQGIEKTTEAQRRYASRTFLAPAVAAALAAGTQAEREAAPEFEASASTAEAAEVQRRFGLHLAAVAAARQAKAEEAAAGQRETEAEAERERKRAREAQRRFTMHLEAEAAPARQPMASDQEVEPERKRARHEVAATPTRAEENTGPEEQRVLFSFQRLIEERRQTRAAIDIGVHVGVAGDESSNGRLTRVPSLEL